MKITGLMVFVGSDIDIGVVMVVMNMVVEWVNNVSGHEIEFIARFVACWILGFYRIVVKGEKQW